MLYGTEITTSDLIDNNDEIINTANLTDSELINASAPKYKEFSLQSANTWLGSGTDNGGMVPSNIPSAIDKLWKFNNKVIDSSSNLSIGPILELKDNLEKDYDLINYNGICLNLNTIGKLLRVGPGSTLVAL